MIVIVINDCYNSFACKHGNVFSDVEWLHIFFFYNCYYVPTIRIFINFKFKY